MNDDSGLTFEGNQLIKELALNLSKINSNDSRVKEAIFRGLANYMKSIKVGIKFADKIVPLNKCRLLHFFRKEAIYLFSRKIFPILFFMTFIFGNAQAQEVTVTGMGIDKDSAVRSASRMAVEKVVGTFIDSRTLMQDLVIQLDEVFKKSQGFIKNIKILDEDRIDASTYRVTAKIDVDTNPHAELVDKITMLLRLNNPRIAVVVLDENIHNNIVESAINSKLVALGFNRILDTAQVIKLYDTQLLANINSGQIGKFEGTKDNITDYLIVGNLNKNSMNVLIPKYGESGMMETSMINAKLNLKISVMKYDTGEIIDTFTVDGVGLENNVSRAEDKASEIIADKAAKKVESVFKKFSSQVSDGFTLTLTANHSNSLEKIVEELRELSIIDNLQVREQSGNKIVVTVESSYKLHEIVNALKNRSKFGIFIENISNSACNLRIS